MAAVNHIVGYSADTSAEMFLRTATWWSFELTSSVIDVSRYSMAL